MTCTEHHQHPRHQHQHYYTYLPISWLRPGIALYLGAMQMQQHSHSCCLGVIKNKAIFTHVPDRIENKMHFPQHDEWLDSILQFRWRAASIKEKIGREKQERVFFSFSYYIIYFLLSFFCKKKYTSAGGVGLAGMQRQEWWRYLCNNINLEQQPHQAW